jgi:hypothetical protein
MDDEQKPPRLGSHTTLRTLFVATTAVAIAVWGWTSDPSGGFVRLLITPLAACFAAGLFGFSLTAGFLIGLVVEIGSDAHRIATLPKDDMAFVDAIQFALGHAAVVMWFVGLSWITATWWGLYLRYAWSNPKWPPIGDVNDDVSSGELRWTIRDRMMVRCAEAPMGFLASSLLANWLVVTLGLILASAW